jgi:adenine-specific DNA-methyltransferase
MCVSLDLLTRVKTTLQKDKRLTSEDGEFLKSKIIELSLKLDKELIGLLMKEDELKEHFFAQIDKVVVFDQNKFLKFVDNKEFLPDSYTTFKNKVGLTVRDTYLEENREVVLSWPYKDCVLEGEMEKEDEKRDEVFFNEILAPDEIDRLKEPKVLSDFKRVDKTGEHEVSEIKPTDNFVFRGNNLLVLCSLKKKYPEAFKLIYIDVPYNTGGDSFLYNDRFNHSTWLTFMRNRLEIARDLLSPDGAIFVQIDLHEIGYLNVLMDEVFGMDNRVQLISVRTASPAGFKTVNPGPVDVTEFILFYTKDRKKYRFKKGYVPVIYDENYDFVIENINEEPRNWKLARIVDVIYEQNGIKVEETHQQSNKNAEEKWGPYWKEIRYNLIAEYALDNCEKVVSIRDPHKPTEKLKELLDKSKHDREKIFVYDKKDENDKIYVINGGALSFYSNKVKTIDGKKTATELLTDLWTDISWDGIAKEGGVKLKNGKKPERLLQRIIEISTEERDKVLDYHLGSGTTCAVAHKMNRQYIGVEQLDYGENDSIVRLKNVINGEQSGISKSINWQGGGEFISCELMKWNKKYIDEVRNAKTSEDLMKIWNRMKEKAFLSFRVDVEEVDKNAKMFEELSITNQKKFLIECLDKNHLYVNLSEIEDKDYGVSKENEELNRKFYGGL